MKDGRGRRGAGLAFVGVLAVLWLGFAPTQIGGSVIYTSTVGNSMAPRFHKGDLALVRSSASYHVGEIVLYRSPVLHRPVLHRILAIEDGHYFFKGDHNDFVDPGYATRADLLGALWFRVPKAGEAVAFVAKPSHSAVLAGLAALAALLPGMQRRRRRVKTHLRAPMHLHRPLHPAEDAVAVALVLGAALALGVGFASPLRRAAVVPGSYRQSGSFMYLARATKPTDAYPDGYARTGQPLFLSNVRMVSIGFTYRFSSRYSHGVRGTIGLAATISSETSSWHHRYVLVKPKPFAGDHASIVTMLDLKGLEDLADQLALAAGTSTIQHDIVVQATVTGRGYVAGHPVTLSFDPQLPFTMTNPMIKLAATASTLPPGAAVGASSAADTESALHPAEDGAIPGATPNTVRLARFRLAILDLRGLGIGLAGLALIVILTRPWRRRHDRWTPEQKLASRKGCVVVDVLALDGGLTRTEVRDFESLTGFASYLARPILHDLSTGAFAAEDGGRLYVWLPAAPAPALPAPVAPANARKGVRLRWLGAGLGVLVVVGVAVSFTAANVVPLTNAGVRTDTTSISELVPAHCAGLTLTHLLVSTTGTATGTPANDLILDASSAKGTLTGGGGNDCIVSGAPKETLDGGAGTSDICIGTGSGTVFKNCEATYTSLG